MDDQSTITDSARLIQYYLQLLVTPLGLLTFVGLIVLVIASLVSRRSLWVWLTVMLYTSSLGFATQMSWEENTLISPIQQIRNFWRPLTFVMLFLLFVRTVLMPRGTRSKLLRAGTVAYFIFELVFSIRYTTAGIFGRGVVGSIIYLVMFLSLGLGLSKSLQTLEDVYASLRCVMMMGGLIILGSSAQVLVNSSAILRNGRLYGTTTNPQHLGSSMAISIAVGCFLLLRRGEPLFWRIIAGVVVGMGPIFLIWSGSRAALIMAFVALGLLFRARIGKLAAAIMVFALIASIGLQFFNESLNNADRLFSTLDTRSGVWTSMWDGFLSNPVFGSPAESSLGENSYLAAASSFGLFGLIPMGVALTLISMDLLRLQRCRHSLGEHAFLANLVTGCLAAILVDGMFDAYLLATITDFIFCFYIFLSLLAFLLDPGFAAAAPSMQHIGQEQLWGVAMEPEG